LNDPEMFSKMVREWVTRQEIADGLVQFN